MNGGGSPGMNGGFSSGAYWEARYAGGGASGAGSSGRLALFKAAFLNCFIAANRIGSILDLGCGDGSQLSLLDLPRYTGVDVSETALARCAARFRGRPECDFRGFATLDETHRAELALSLDVVYHLIDDAAFAEYMRRLFACPTRFAIVYSSNADLDWPAAHVRHRRFTAHVARHHAAWRLLAHVPNPHPFDPARPDDTSFADFYVFGREGGEGCVITVPG